jgi:hypothetical protein
VNRFAPGILLIVVTALFLGYGSSEWSWLAGPVAALVLWALALKAREPELPALRTSPHPSTEPALSQGQSPGHGWID